MNKSELVNILNSSIIANLSESIPTTVSKAFEDTLQEVYARIGNIEEISSALESITKHCFSDPDILEWKYLISCIYIIRTIGDVVDDPNNTELLSVKEIKILKTSIAQIVFVGIYSKLQPKLPFYINKTYTKTDDIFYQYNVLKCSILALCNFLKNDHLRVLILSDSLRAILTGLYQIAYCPLRKSFDSTFTEEIYNRLVQEKEMAITLIRKLKETIYPSIYIKETMIIFQQNAPVWFKKAVSQTLTSIMLSPKGVEHVAVAILDGAGNDKAKTWRALDVIFRLISSCKNQLDFRENICQQVVKLVDNTNEESLVFERLFVTCTRNFYSEDVELSKSVFVKPVVIVLLRFTLKDCPFEEGAYTDRIKRCLRVLHAIFVEKAVENNNLPVDMLKPILAVIFRIYCVTLNSVFKTTNSEAKEILLKYISDCPKDDNVVFDSFLFEICDIQNILALRKDIVLEIKGQDIYVNVSQYNEATSISENSQSLLKLLQNNSMLLTRFFRYLLRCLINREKYFRKANTELLNLESEIMNEYFERSLVVFKLLSDLADNKAVQKAITDAPADFVDYVKDVLDRTIETSTHKTREFESDGFQTLFTVIMILNALIQNYSKKTFKILVKPLETVQSETAHKELSDLVRNILNRIEISSDKTATKIRIEEAKSELDIILEDICDALLPVRGHGLMALRKLVEKKDSSAMDKKQYILTIFQQNLKNDDSFIYLSAVDGLAAMANIFTDSVINTLCEEYTDFGRKGDDGHEVRIKLGEVLVRVTKLLGEMAPKYKAVLLNTFLVGTKDDDFLVRASSLSNLGEICRVLGYKLGTMITEVLVCVHAIITTDKAIEARRAAVTVIRQLLAGLESEMVAFLKDDILPIYRTLKQIYRNDNDDVMRLQAQLALEELNENMKSFVFPKPELNTEKKIIMLD